MILKAEYKPRRVSADSHRFKNCVLQSFLSELKSPNIMLKHRKQEVDTRRTRKTDVKKLQSDIPWQQVQ
jgi:hypothetical protein